MQEFSQIDTFNKIARWWGFYIQSSKTGQNYFQCASVSLYFNLWSLADLFCGQKSSTKW